MTYIVKALMGGDERFVVCQARHDNLTGDVHLQVYCPEFSGRNRSYGLSFNLFSEPLSWRLRTLEGIVSKSLAGSNERYLILQATVRNDQVVFQIAKLNEHKLATINEYEVYAPMVASVLSALLAEATT